MFVARRSIRVAVTALTMAVLMAAAGWGADKASSPSGVLRDGFETPHPTWLREYTDATVKLVAQERSQRAAHEGRLSERFQFEAGPGSQFFVSYATPKIPVSDDLRASLYVRSSRAGVQIFARIVLPSDVDPETKAPSYVLVPGTIFDQPDRWQRLELLHMLPVIERQARVLRVRARRPVRLDGAYLERVVVNLLGGPGESEVFLDELGIEPVPRDMAAGWNKADPEPKSEKPGQKGSAVARRDASAASRIRLERNLLEKKGADGVYHPWFPTAIDAPGANPLDLRHAGFDLLVEDGKTDPKRLGPAIAAGALLMMRLDPASGAGGIQRLLEQMNSYARREAVAFWQVGDNLGQSRQLKTRQEELAKIREVLSAVRSSTRSRN